MAGRAVQLQVSPRPMEYSDVEATSSGRRYNGLRRDVEHDTLGCEDIPDSRLLPGAVADSERSKRTCSCRYHHYTP